MMTHASIIEENEAITLGGNKKEKKEKKKEKKEDDTDTRGTLVPAAPGQRRVDRSAVRATPTRGAVPECTC